MFDYAEAIEAFIGDVAKNCRVLGHIDVSSLLIGCIRARNAECSGLYARTIPLRFEGGSTTTVRKGVPIRIPIVRHGDREALYMISFCLPRFQNLQFEDKVMTIFHELYHTSPNFDGDIRRFAGSKYVHTASQKKYDELMRELSQQYLQQTARPELHEFLRLNYAELCERHGGVKMRIFRAPRPEIVKDNAARTVSVHMQEKKEKR
ncbi:MAG TPA: putative metallopeptidase [Planctomycetota bacterium]|nr:putative metallopeptidase [Planctomycetota bacterium]